MIQILGLRTFTPKGSSEEKKYDAFHDKKWRATNVPALFKNLAKHLNDIPEKEKWNLFYTLANCTEDKRDFESLGVIAFDIDGINTKYVDNYAECICTLLDINTGDTGLVSSGHGIHLLIGLKKPIKTRDEIKALKPHYKEVCRKINAALEKAGLPGEADPTIFEPRRILRLPGTANRKPGKPEVMATLEQNNIKTIKFDLKELSGLPEVGEKDQISTAMLRRYPRNDPDAVLEGCAFLKHAAEKPAEINEPQWYAALSITARLKTQNKDGEDYSHEISKGHPNYTKEATDEKIAQAMEASGPRTCSSINAIWSGCSACPNYEKVTSPILIRSEECIPTEFTGFHNVPWDGKGKPTPNYEDLRRFFQREFYYRGLGGSKMVQTWNGMHYEYMENAFLEGFAQDHFDPKASCHMRREFREVVSVTNLTKLEWYEETTRRKMNFHNGYLNIDTMEFQEHDKDLGFRYVLPYDYDKTAKAPTFEKMLDQVTGGDKDTQKVLLEYMGYCLSNDACWAQKVLVLDGTGANGKSTFMDLVKKLAGKGNYSSLTMEDINKSEYNRQMLDGKLFNVSEETPTKSLVNNSIFKSLATGGEVQVRSPYKEPYFIRNSAKLIFSCNELPSSSDNSYGFYRRLIIVPFTQKFTKDIPGFDPHIDIKLEKELAGIFNMAMEGYHRLVKQKRFTEAKKVEQTLEDYRIENDSVLRWFKDNVVIHTNGGFEENFAPIQDLYMGYKLETESEGEKAVTMIKFAKTLAMLIPGYEERCTRKTINHKRTRGLQGISTEGL